METDARSGRKRSRLAALDGFAESADGVPATADAPGSSDGRRLVLDTSGDDVPEELPDVAHEVRTLRRILEINKRLARRTSEAGLLEEFLDAAGSLTGAARGFLVGGDGNGSVRVHRSRDPAGGSVPAAQATISATVVRRVLSGRGPIVLDDFQRDAVRLGADRDEAPGVRAVLCVPFPGEEPLALYLDSRREEALFSHLDADLLLAFAEQAGLCVERVRLLGDNQRQREELTAANQRAEALNERLSALVEKRTAELRDAREDLALVDGEFRQRFTEIVGRGPAMMTLLRQVDRVSDTNVPVLFEGGSGTGKELMARALHAGSRRSEARFVAENCAALPDSLLENELFGHERGAFTGAEAATMGLFERADGGTLFLDEVGDMSANLQKRLLRVLQEGEVRRVGGSSVRSVDVRIVTATNRDLMQLVRAGRFREDLYYRLAVVKVRVPPLRERREDIPDLVRHFLARFCENGRATPLDRDALDLLVRFDWPGNVRQLENEVRRAMALSPDRLGKDVLSPEVRSGQGIVPDVLVDPVARRGDRALKAMVEELEVRVLQAVLERESGNITRTARALGLSRLGLRKKMQRYGLTKPGA